MKHEGEGKLLRQYQFVGPWNCGWRLFIIKVRHKHLLNGSCTHPMKWGETRREIIDAWLEPSLCLKPEMRSKSPHIVVSTFWHEPHTHEIRKRRKTSSTTSIPGQFVWPSSKPECRIFIPYFRREHLLNGSCYQKRWKLKRNNRRHDWGLAYARNRKYDN